MLRQLWNLWKNRLPNTVGAARQQWQTRLPRTRPGVETLEDRVVLNYQSAPFTDIAQGQAGVTTLTFTDVDDGFATVNLGNDCFRYYGTSFSTMAVGVNGIIQFGTTGNASFINSALTAGPMPATIAPYWDDLYIGRDAFDDVMTKFYDVNADGRNDYLTVEWQAYHRSDAVNATTQITFQVSLQLNTGARDGNIVFNYIDLDTGGTTNQNGASATIGIKNAGVPPTQSVQVSFNTALTSTQQRQFSRNSATAPNYNLQILQNLSTGTGATNILDNTDDGSVSFTLSGSNTFRFYGTTYTSFFVNNNGWITFGSANGTFTNTALASVSQAAIAPLWDDMLTSVDANDMVLAQTFDVNGDSVADYQVIEWQVYHINNTSAASGDLMEFQAILQLNTGNADGDVYFNYFDITTSGAATSLGASATVGIKDVGLNPVAGKINQLSFNTALPAATKGFALTQENFAPSAVTVTPPAGGFTENTAGNVTIAFTDPDATDTHTISIDWDGDNVVDQTVNLAAGVTSTVVARTYLDDGPSPGNGTASDNVTINVTVADPCNPVAKASAATTVNNVAPSNLNINYSATTLNENGVLTISGTFTDPGTLDAHTVVINWGDGTPNTTINLAAGVTAIPNTNHTYLDDGTSPGNNTPSDNYTVSITVTDDDTGSVNTTKTITVNNVAPNTLNITYSATTLNENQTLTVGGTFVDPGTLDAHTVVINWGDGTPNTTLNLAAGVTTIANQTHTYLDDGPSPGNGTASDIYTVTITVTDDDTGSVSTNQNITVNDVAPSALTVTLDKTTLNEGETITLSGSFTDPGTLDEHTVVISWGDGSPNTTINLAAGVTTISSITHVYADDLPTGTSSDTATITVTVTDDDTLSTAVNKNVTVNNIAPSNLTLTPGSIDENNTFNLVGSFTDPGAGDTHKLFIDWNGDGTFDQTVNLAAGVTNFSVTSPTFFDDDPNGTASDIVNIKAQVQDDDTGITPVVTTQLTVKNVPPTNLQLTSPSFVDEGGTLTVSGTFDDPGSKDVHTVLIDWNNDGTFDDTINLAAGVLSFSKTGPSFVDDDPSGTPFDINQVKVRVTDDDLGQAETVFNIEIRNVAPSNLALSLDKTTINEMQTVTLGGTFTDPGANDTFTVVINWGDGTANTTVNLGVGARSFAGITHTYADDNPSGTPQDNYNIVVTVTDDDTGSTNKNATVTVKNIAPILNLGLDKTSINENDTVTLSGTVTFAGDVDSHVVVINWGDGSANTTLNLASGTINFSTTHQYLNDDVVGGPGNGTASDNFTITVNVTDDDTGTAATNFNVTVKNVVPGNLVLSNPFTINEDDSITLTGEFTDPGSQDKHTVEIDWNGDGTYDQTLNLAAGVLTFSATHQYLDDVPTNSPVDTNAINVRVRDFDLGEVTGATAVTVNNVNPAITSLTQYPLPINENDSITLTGTFTDKGTLDQHTVMIDWDGDNVYEDKFVLGVGARSFTRSHQYLDDNPTGTPVDVQVINVRVMDDDTGFGDGATSVTIKNINPILNVTGPITSVLNVPITFNVDFSDIGTQDTHRIGVDWGDGTTDGFVTVTSPTTLTHAFQKLGKLTATFTLVDDDTGTVTVTRTLNVSPVGIGVDICDPNNPNMKSLYATGTNRNDNIVFTTGAAGGVAVVVNGKNYGTFFPNTHVIGIGFGGNDRISVSPALHVPALLYGGDGNDVLTGSNGADMLFGENGNDTLIGGHGRDILIGGFGSDMLYGHYTVQRPVGKDDQDILVGNATIYDNQVPTACSLIGEWARTDVLFDQRRETIRTGAGGVPELSLNTIIEDNAMDRLFSVRSTDWLFKDTVGKDKYFGPVASQLSN
jgi:hypothetical protein